MGLIVRRGFSERASYGFHNGLFRHEGEEYTLRHLGQAPPGANGYPKWVRLRGIGRGFGHEIGSLGELHLSSTVWFA